MKKRALIILLLLVAFTVPVAAIGTGTGAGPSNYTYNYSFWGEEIAMPDAYYVADTIMGRDFGIGNFSNPQGLYIRDNRIYVCDTDNDRIVLIEYNEETNTYELVRVVTSVLIYGLQSPLSKPHGIFENRNGEIFIADTENNRVLRLDNDFNFINTIVRPDDQSYDEGVDFLPTKLVVDFSNRVFIQARHINKGLMEYNVDGTFHGYMGASPVQVNLWDYFWKLIASDAQRAQMELFVPTEYNNVTLDHEGFVYATLSTFTGNPFDADPVRRLNAVGTDILIRNGMFGYSSPAGDWYWSSFGGVSGPSRFADVVTFENDGYICLDRNRGRLFAYDFQGNLLYVFGGRGNMEGRFVDPVALDRMGTSLFVLDARTATITRFNLTEYGKYIDQAMNYYFMGLYDESAAMWDEVLKLNGNYDLAFIGKGRAALRNEQYYEAMKFYEAKYDQESYGKAFQLYRKEWIEEHITTIVIILLSLWVAVKALKITLKIRKKRKGGAQS
jgi:DNA-binding beta-propeller fold protein YncE